MRARSPRYVEIAHELRDRIASGEIRPGERIPTERELMETYGVSVTVARSAVAQLRGEGIIESRQGKGSFVRERREVIRFSPRQRHRAGKTPNRREEVNGGWEDKVTAEARVVSATTAVAGRLSIESGDMVSEVTYRWYSDGELVQVSQQWEPLKLTAGTPIERPAIAKGDPDVVTRFASIGLPVTHVREHIRARMPRPDEADALSVPEGVPVFHITRTHFAEETAVETADILIRADRVVIENVDEIPAEPGVSRG